MSRFVVDTMKTPAIDQLTALSDIELFVALCATEDDVVVYREFVKRFLPDLKVELINYCRKRNLDDHIGAQIAHDTLEKARKYKSFNPQEIRARTDRKAVLVYLFKIAYRLFWDYFRKERSHSDDLNEHKSYFDDLMESASSDQDAMSLLHKREKSIGIIKKLTPKEQKVFLTDLEYKRNQKYNYLPDHVTESLAAELGVKPATIRKMRERAITKIKKAIDEINQETE